MVDLDSKQSQANDLGAENRGEIYLDIVKFGGITLVSKNYRRLPSIPKIIERWD